jgi:hypothetical protein
MRGPAPGDGAALAVSAGSVVGWTGVTRRGRVAPDCADASAEQRSSAAAAPAKAFVSLFIEGKSFITRRAVSITLSLKGEAQRRMPSAPPRFAGI